MIDDTHDISKPHPTDALAAIDWIDLMVAMDFARPRTVPIIGTIFSEAPRIPTLGRDANVHPNLREMYDWLLAMPEEQALEKLLEQIIVWRIQHDGLKGWRMGADGKWTRVDE